MPLYLSLILSFCLALVAYLKKAIEIKALLLAFIFSVIICYIGGYVSYIILVVVFLLTILSNKIKINDKKKINEDIIEKSEKKDIFQIVANVGTGVLLIILYYVTDNICFLVSYAAVMSESLADSLGSNIGVLSKKEPINIVTLKPSIKGLSGNVSSLGIIASILGTVVISLIFMIYELKLKFFLVIVLSGFFGTIVDSYLGACIQVKYQCSVCKKITEKRNHCYKSTKYLSGIKFLNNDFINLMSNVVTGLFSIFLMLFV